MNELTFKNFFVDIINKLFKQNENFNFFENTKITY